MHPARLLHPLVRPQFHHMRCRGWCMSFQLQFSPVIHIISGSVSVPFSSAPQSEVAARASVDLTGKGFLRIADCWKLP